MYLDKRRGTANNGIGAATVRERKQTLSDGRGSDNLDCAPFLMEDRHEDKLLAHAGRRPLSWQVAPQCIDDLLSHRCCLLERQIEFGLRRYAAAPRPDS